MTPSNPPLQRTWSSLSLGAKPLNAKTLGGQASRVGAECRPSGQATDEGLCCRVLQRTLKPKGVTSSSYEYPGTFSPSNESNDLRVRSKLLCKRPLLDR